MSRYLPLTLLALAAIALLGRAVPHATAAVQPSGGAWTQLMPTVAPPARDSAAMAASPGGGLVLFGGSIHPDTGLVALGDTWTFANGAWTEQHPALSPPPRAGAAIAYDEARRVTVLFGGNTFTERLSDTWTWDGTTWSLHQPPLAPSGQGTATMTYDAPRGVVLLYQGPASFEGTAETWAWDGATWTPLTPETSPPPRAGATMAYDAANQLVVLYGGCSVAPQNCPPVYDTWTWDGITWTPRTSAAEPPVSGPSPAYHAGLQAVILYGATNQGGFPPPETWAWNGTTWTALDPAVSPPRRSAPSIAYDAAMDAIILFGGQTFTAQDDAPLSDTWAFTGAR